MTRVLIDTRWLRSARAAATVGAIVLAVLAAVVFHGTTTQFDTWAFRVLVDHLDAHWAEITLAASTPAIDVVALVVVGAAALRLRRYDLGALCVIAPTAGVLLTETVLKPIVHRTMGPGSVAASPNAVDSLAFPSGHETGVACTAIVLFVAVCQLPVRRVGKAAAATVLALWMVVAAVGLVRNFWHYASDTIGAVALSLAVVFATALAIDALRGWSVARAPTADRHRDQLTLRS